MACLQWRTFLSAYIHTSYMCLRRRLTNNHARDRANSWINNHLIFSGLLTASTFLAVISPYADFTSSNQVQVGDPLVNSKSDLFSWIRGLCATSFLFSILCVSSGFAYWKIINHASIEDYKELFGELGSAAADSATVPKEVPWKKLGWLQIFFDWLLNSSLVLSTFCAIGAIILATLVVMHDSVAIGFVPLVGALSFLVCLAFTIETFFEGIIKKWLYTYKPEPETPAPRADSQKV